MAELNEIYFDEDYNMIFDGRIPDPEVMLKPVQSNYVTSGLTQYIDGADYVEGSGEWLDRMGTHDITVYGDLKSSTWNGGIGVMDVYSTITTGALNTSNDLRTGDWTIVAAARNQTIGVGASVLIGSGTESGGRMIIGYGGQADDCYFAGGWVYNASALRDMKWRIYIISQTAAINDMKLSINNVDKTLLTVTRAGPQGVSFGNRKAGGFLDHCAGSEFGLWMTYNRVLTDEEKTQNFNYFRHRYGL